MNEGFEYFEEFLDLSEADYLYELFYESIPWEQHSIKIFGREVLEPRLIYSYGDLSYTYSSKKMTPQPFSGEIEKLRKKVEKYVESSFNFALINLYRDGQDSMGAHSDDEKELGFNPIIASLSLGDTRDFIIKHKQSKQRDKISLQHGSLLVMSGDSQKDYTHELPKTKKEKKPRINITFRYIKNV